MGTVRCYPLQSLHREVWGKLQSIWSKKLGERGVGIRVSTFILDPVYKIYIGWFMPAKDPMYISHLRLGSNIKRNIHGVSSICTSHIRSVYYTLCISRVYCVYPMYIPCYRVYLSIPKFHLQLTLLSPKQLIYHFLTSPLRPCSIVSVRSWHSDIMEYQWTTSKVLIGYTWADNVWLHSVICHSFDCHETN